MNAINYDREMRSVCESFGGEKRRLLLHACCAPCSSACLERLKEYFDITVFFYNPNIAGDEYYKRKSEIERFLSITGWAKLADCGHDEREYYSAVKGFENCAEGGERCARCFALRLGRCAEEAKSGGYDYFTTTLTISPLKNAELINKLGREAADAYGARWLPCDFKKRDGYLRSIRLSEEYGLYRQNYCGCTFSLKELEKRNEG